MDRILLQKGLDSLLGMSPRAFTEYPVVQWEAKRLVWILGHLWDPEDVDALTVAYRG